MLDGGYEFGQGYNIFSTNKYIYISEVNKSPQTESKVDVTW